MFASFMWCFTAWKSLKHNTVGTWWIGFDDFIKYTLFTGWFIFSTCLWQDHDKIYCSNMLRCWEKPLPVPCYALFSQSVLKTNVDVVTLVHEILLRILGLLVCVEPHAEDPRHLYHMTDIYFTHLSPVKSV